MAKNIEINILAIKIVVALFVFAFSSTSFAQNTQDATAGVGGDYVDVDGYRVFHTLFPSKFVPANVAASYGLKRSKYENILNIFVAKKGERGGIKSKISGTTKNLMQQLKTLKFKEIVEKNTVYYLASVRISGEEIMHFSIDIVPELDVKPLTIKFSKKVYAGE